MTGDIRDWLTLLSAPGLGPAAFSCLLGRFRSPAAALRAPLQGLCEIPGIGRETARAIRAGSSRSWASDQVSRAAEAGVEIITLRESAYPRLLRRIYAPPPVLFVQGDIQVCAAPSIAIVGSRSFTPYGRDCAFRLAGDLAEMGITTVSGMAMGIQHATPAMDRMTWSRKTEMAGAPERPPETVRSERPWSRGRAVSLARRGAKGWPGGRRRRTRLTGTITASAKTPNQKNVPRHPISSLK